MIALDDAQHESGAVPCLAVLEPRVRACGKHFGRTARHLGIHSTVAGGTPPRVSPGAAITPAEADRSSGGG